MKSFCAPLLLAIATTAVLAQQSKPAISQFALQQPAASTTSEATSISKAKDEIAAHPKNADGYTALALALSQRARDTWETTFYSQAEEAVMRALEIAPNNFEAEKARVLVALGRHEFTHARDLARELNKRVPDDVAIYGFLADANIAIGDYGEAEQATQWMLNLRPGNIPALVRTAELRQLFGDHEGAIEVLRMILDSTIAIDTENRAWAFNQIGQISLETGKLDSAESAFDQALVVVPNFVDSLRDLAQLRLMQNRPVEAVGLLRQSYTIAPRVATLYELGVALEAAGNKGEAQSTFTEFEQKSLSQSEHADNTNRELVFYYADQANEPAKALRIARTEIVRRHDVHTLDAFAWALYRNGQYSEAKTQIDRALQVGLREAPVFYHSGQIATRLGESSQAEHYFQMAAELNSIKSGEAARALALLKPPNQNTAK